MPPAYNEFLHYGKKANTSTCNTCRNLRAALDAAPNCAKGFDLFEGSAKRCPHYYAINVNIPNRAGY